jgi:acetyltransferase
MTVRHLDRLLAPRSIALVGASDRAGSVGATVWRNLRSSGFSGAVYAVNPAHDTLDGERVYASIAQLPQAPDLAVVCTPPATVPGLIAELGRAGTRAAIVMTAGLDAAQKQAMLDAAQPHLLRVLGPNCLGLLVPHLGLNASFAHTDALPGELAFVSQSGALATAVLDWTQSRRIGLSHMISVGESADVDFGDLLDYLASDPRTRAILLYIESVHSARKFMSAARAAARNKPVIVVKAGRAGQGVAAAASHTGAMAGADIVFDAAIRRAGMLRVDTLQQLFIAAQTLSRLRANRDDELTIVTNGGGAGVLAADAAAAAGVPLHALDADLRQQLDTLLPRTWSHANPIDIIGDAPIERYTATLHALLERADSGAVLLLHAPTAIVRSDDIARACVPIVRKAAPRVMACWLGDAAVADARRQFEDAGIADYETPEQAVQAFAMLRDYRRNQAVLTEAPAATGNGTPDLPAARAVIAAARAGGREWLDEAEAKAVLQAFGIPVVATQVTPPDPEAAAAAATRCGYPVALKIQSPAITHKSDVGGVRLELRDALSVQRAAEEMLASVHRLRPDACVSGFTVQQMVEHVFARELIVGASVDPAFGPVILFGHGGTAVEVLADRAVALPPLNRRLALDVIGRTRVARLLQTYRDQPAVRIEAVCDVLIAVSQMLADLPELLELDINPLCCSPTGVVALDARMRIGPPSSGSERFAILPYPAQEARSVRWRGEMIEVRPVRPEDQDHHQAFLARVSSEDLRLRFFSSGRRELPVSELARLVQIDYAREMAFIATTQLSDGSTETLGVVRAVTDPDNVQAEFALLVRSDLKRQGLGRLLLARIVEYLRSRGTQRVVGEVMAENVAMRALVGSFGFVCKRHPFDSSVVSCELDL